MSPPSEPELDPLGQPLGAVYTEVVRTQPEPKKSRLSNGLKRAIFGVIAVASITTATVFSFTQGSSGTDPRSTLTLIAPAGVGGGWDSFARAQQQAMRTDGIVRTVQVVNIPGAGGTIGLAAFANMDDPSSTLLATGAAMTGGIEINKSPVGFDDVRPVAKVAEDYSLAFISADAPWQNLDEFVAAFLADPSSIRFTGGSVGSIDHLIIAQLAQSLGIDPSVLTYIPKSGGGEATLTLLSGTADVAVTGYNEVADQIDGGKIKPLAISAPQRLEGVDVPTFEELGYDVNLVNWRGFLASKQLSDEEFQGLREIVTETSKSDAWAESLARNKWVDAYIDGAEFEAFLKLDQERMAELVGRLGL